MKTSVASSWHFISTYATYLRPGPLYGRQGPGNWQRLLPTRHWMYVVVALHSCGSFPRTLRCRKVSRILNPQERNGVIYQRAFCSASPRIPRTTVMAVRSPEYRLREWAWQKCAIIGVCLLMRSYCMRRPSALTSQLKNLHCSTSGCL